MPGRVSHLNRNFFLNSKTREIIRPPTPTLLRRFHPERPIGLRLRTNIAEIAPFCDVLLQPSRPASGKTDSDADWTTLPCLYPAGTGSNAIRPRIAPNRRRFRNCRSMQVHVLISGRGGGPQSVAT